MKHIMWVFDIFQEYGFKVKDVKCDFFLTEIKDGRRPDPDRATAIKNMALDNVQAQQSFLGLANLY